MGNHWNVWQQVCRALKDGTILRKPCQCGNARSFAHHEDYSKPLDVTWLCARCHAKAHVNDAGRRQYDPAKYPRHEPSQHPPLTPAECALRLGVGRSAIYGLGKSGRLAVHGGSGRALAFTLESAEEEIALRSQGRPVNLYNPIGYSRRINATPGAYPRIESSSFPPVAMRVAQQELARSQAYPYTLAKRGMLAIHGGTLTGKLGVTRESLDACLKAK